MRFATCELAVEEGLELNFLLEGRQSYSHGSVKLRSVIADSRLHKKPGLHLDRSSGSFRSSGLSNLPVRRQPKRCLSWSV